MKKWTLVLAALAIVAVGSQTFAISSGPGGRLYLAGYTGSLSTQMYSIRLDENWDFVDADWINHGTINDNVSGNAYHLQAGCSPEILTPGGDGYGELQMGQFYNSSPLGGLGTNQTMDILKVTPSEGGKTIEVMGDGRATTGGGSAWSHRQDKVTEQAEWQVPVEGGTFMQQYVYGGNAFMLNDTNGDGDITDDVEDYTAQLYAQRVGYSSDTEHLGDKAFVSTTYGPEYSGADGIYYFTPTGAGSFTRSVFYRDGTMPGDLADVSGTGFAVGMVQGHMAAWMTSYEVDCGTYGTHHLALFIDLNDDGDAMDSGEAKWIYDNLSASVHAVDNVGGDAWCDLELVTNEQGTMFLLVYNSTANWAHGRSLLVLELADNGEYAGGNESVKVIATQLISAAGTAGNNEIEFDSNLDVQGEIPEPATLLLVGTGAIAALGFIRRRRMG